MRSKFYLVIDAGKSPLYKGQVLTEAELDEATKCHGEGFSSELLCVMRVPKCINTPKLCTTMFTDLTSRINDVYTDQFERFLRK